MLLNINRRIFYGFDYSTRCNSSTGKLIKLTTVFFNRKAAIIARAYSLAIKAYALKRDSCWPQNSNALECDSSQPQNSALHDAATTTILPQFPLHPPTMMISATAAQVPLP